MSENKTTELQRLEILRMSNEESNQITTFCIESALIQLMKNNCFRNISITDIVKRAGVSRTAYYRNYKSKEDILHSIMQKIVDKVMVAMNLQYPIKNTYKYWYRLFFAIKQQANIFEILLSANFGDTILVEVHNKLQPYIQESYATDSYKSYFWIGAIYNVAAAWIRNGMQQTVEEMAKICYRIIDNIDNDCSILK